MVRNSFLFTWNPQVWPWTHLDKQIAQLKTPVKPTEAWAVSSHKLVRPGDRAFVMRLGVEPKGIVASGYILNEPEYTEEKGIGGKLRARMRVTLQFDVLRNAEMEPVLLLEWLKQGNTARQNWTPRASGIVILPEAAAELELLWNDFLANRG